MTLYPVEISETAVSGAWSENTIHVSGGVILQIYLKAATSTTTFQFKVTDDYDNIIYDTDQLAVHPTGTLNAFVYIPIRGICTFDVYDSSVDEAFTGRIMIED